MRRTLLAIGAAVALAAAALPTSASAQRHGHWGGHHFGGPGISFGFGVAPAPFYGGYYDYGFADDCYRVHRVWTSYGWRLRRMYVC